MNKIPIPEKKKALIIGSGIAGMATAIRLQHKGYEVEVFEANAYPGGKLSQIKQGNYRFDAGPSLFTMPQYVDELFSLWGRDPKTAFPYTKKAESCRYFWNDNTRLTAHADNKLFAMKWNKNSMFRQGWCWKSFVKAKKCTNWPEGLF